MGLFRVKIGTIGVAAVAALFSLSAIAAMNNNDIGAPGRAPASSDGSQAPPSGPCSTRDAKNLPECMSQADAFSTASEQAVYLGAYQMSFGPYGQFRNKEERDKLLRETAAAIQDCMAGTDCGSDKQEKVLKALVQYNVAQEIKRMMLENNTNREKMRSLDPTADPDFVARVKGQVANPDQVYQAYGKGKIFSVDTKGLKPVQIGEEGEIDRGSGSTKDSYYQLDEPSVKLDIDPAYLREKEILGDQFLKEYGAFFENYATTGPKRQENFYKFVPAKQDGKLYVYDERAINTNGRDREIVRDLDQDKFNQLGGEQQNSRISGIAQEYRKNMKPIYGYVDDKGDAAFDFQRGQEPEKLGIGEIADVDPANFPEVNFQDLMKNGKITPENQARAAARATNAMFRETAMDEERKKAVSEGRDPASVKAPSDATHNIVLSPEKFDQFLEDIWPSEATRKQRLSQLPAAAGDNAASAPILQGSGIFSTP